MGPNTLIMRNCLAIFFLLALNLGCAQSNAIAIYQVGNCYDKEVDPSILFEHNRELTIQEQPARDNSITKEDYMPAYVAKNTFNDFDKLLRTFPLVIGDTNSEEQFKVIFYDDKRESKYVIHVYGVESANEFLSKLLSETKNPEVQRLLKYHIEMMSICDDLIKANK